MIVNRLFSMSCVLALSAALAPSDAEAARVNYGDRTICVEYYECTDVCEVDRYGYESCDTVCDPVQVCYGGGPEELPDSDTVCDLDDPDFFACFLQ